MARHLFRLIAIFASLFATSIGQAAEWTLGFEETEGFIPGPIEAGEVVTVLGGTATVQTGEAADGRQFARFAPGEATNGLVLRLPAVEPGAVERRLEISLRLPEGATGTRFVFAQSMAIALRVTDGELQLEAGDGIVRTAPASPDPVRGVWLRVGLREEIATHTWDVYVDGLLVFEGLATPEDAATVSDSLVFADGELDVDSIRLVSREQEDITGGPPTPGDDTVVGDETVGTERPRGALDEEEMRARLEARKRVFAEAVALAEVGDFAALETLILKSGRHPEGTARWHLEGAHILSSVAFALNQRGEPSRAVEVARLAATHLEYADAKFAPGDHSRTRASAPFLLGQIKEELLGDRNEARRLFERALEVSPSHLRAAGELKRLDEADEELDRKRGTESGEGGRQ